MTGKHGIKALDKALEAAASTRLPIMVHISKGAETRQILQKLRPGDIVTHCFQGRGDGIFEEGNRHLLPEVLATRKEGIVFDVGHGAGSFSWETARKAFEHFFYPDTISSDLHRFSIARWAFDMPTVMSKFLHLGMSLQDVILKSTWAPAKAIGKGNELGTLKPGAVADLFAFEIEDGDFPLEDTHLRTQYASRRIKPALVINDGRRIQPGSWPARLRPLEECDEEMFRFIEQTANPS
jgi:dihydroorotase